MDQKTSSHHQDPRTESWWIENYGKHEVSALLLGGLAAMILLSLVSYSPEQLPEWFPWFVKAEAIEAGGNFVGPIGAALAGVLFLGFGAACYLIPAILAWWAIQVVSTKRTFNVRNFIAITALLISTSCLVDCQTLLFTDWVDRYQLPGSAGGSVGLLVGDGVLVRFFGPGGTFIMMSIAATLALIVVTGVHPLHSTKRATLRLIRIFREVDWEDKWRLWSGMAPREPVYPQHRALPTINSIAIEPVLTADVSPVVEEAPPVLEAVPVAAEPDFATAAQARAPRHESKPVVTAPVTGIVDETGGKDPKAGDEDPVNEPEIPTQERVRRIIDNSQKPQSDPMIDPLANSGQFEGYQLPSLEILSYAEDLNAETDDETLIEIQNQIVETLKSFKVEVEPGDITKGPTITRYEVYPSPGLRVSKITTLKDDIARATRAEKINILAPIPGKDTVGIEIANSNKTIVALRELFESEAFRNSSAKLPLVLGKDVYGQTIVGDLTRMPHLLVAGATGSGKSVCINAIIASLLYRFTPDELKFIMIDPKVVEMQLYNSLPHMVVPVVTEPKRVLVALRWVIKEMERRYRIFADKGVRSFEGFNAMRDKQERARILAEQRALQPNLINTETGEDFLEIDESVEEQLDAETQTEPSPEKLPYIVVIIDELADLMQTAPADVEISIARIAQKARAAGIHLIIATQTPRADVVTGTIKANIPSRIAFQVSSKTDSRIILDENGAENLVGKGDMLYLPPGAAQHIRAQGALITDDEAQSLVDACAAQGAPPFEDAGDEEAGFAFMEEEEDGFSDISEADEEIISKCLEVILTEKKASTSLLQRKLRLGYTRAARMIDILESRGIIGPGDGAKPREILVNLASE